VFLSFTKEKDFPIPAKISQKTNLWDRVECAFWLSEHSDNKFAKEFVKEYQKNSNDVMPIPILMKKASLARYIGVSSCLLQFLIQRTDDFPKPIQAFFQTPVYTVLSVNQWLHTKMVDQKQKIKPRTA